MLDRLLFADWDHPPDAMAFEESYEEALGRVGQILPRVLAGKEQALAEPAALPPGYWDDCLALYLHTPAIVNVALNYKVCLEQGLPLHPTYYFEVREPARFQTRHPEPVVRGAQALFLESIAVARAIFALDPDSPARLRSLRAGRPEVLASFVYTSTRDKYTWRASDPRKVARLASAVHQALQPALLVGAAHGSIMPGLLLANLLDTPLYFVRFSAFKRNDTGPILAPSDTRFLEAYGQGPVLLFDEDVAKGTTLARFAEVMGPLFRTWRTAGVLRHALSRHRPDFTGLVWHD